MVGGVGIGVSTVPGGENFPRRSGMDQIPQADQEQNDAKDPVAGEKCLSGRGGKGKKIEVQGRGVFMLLM